MSNENGDLRKLLNIIEKHQHSVLIDVYEIAMDLQMMVFIEN